MCQGGHTALVGSQECLACLWLSVASGSTVSGAGVEARVTCIILAEAGKEADYIENWPFASFNKITEKIREPTFLCLNYTYPILVMLEFVSFVPTPLAEVEC